MQINSFEGLQGEGEIGGSFLFWSQVRVQSSCLVGDLAGGLCMLGEPFS